MDMTYSKLRVFLDRWKFFEAFDLRLMDHLIEMIRSKVSQDTSGECAENFRIWSRKLFERQSCLLFRIL